MIGLSKALQIYALVVIAISLPLNHTTTDPAPISGYKSNDLWPPKVNEYDESIQRGARLYALMLSEQPERSAFQEICQVSAWGWRNHFSQVDPEWDLIYNQLRGPLTQLGISPQGLEILRTHHDTETTHEGKVHPPTNGQYDIVYSPKGRGAIFAWEAYSPEYRVKQSGKDIPVPKLQRWSDLAWLNWRAANLHRPPENLKNLKYVVKAPVVNKTTRDIVKKALIKDGIKDGMPGEFPGHLFEFHSRPILGRKNNAMEAVIGTENVAGAAYLLAQHRDVMGDKIIRGVRVWVQPSGKTEREKKSPTYVMVVHIGDPPAEKKGGAAVKRGLVDISKESSEERNLIDARGVPGFSSSAQMGPSNSEFTYQVYAERGVELYQMMVGKVSTPKTTFTDYEDLKDWGWRVVQKKSDLQVNQILDQISGPMQQLGITGTRAQIRKATHAKVSKHGGITFQPTGAHYYDFYYPNDGAILAWDNASPEYVSQQSEHWGNKPLPSLQHFSDVVFLNWVDVGANPVSLKTIIRYPVNNGDTQNVVRQALINDGVKSGEPGAWPGHVFKFKSKGLLGKKNDAFEALLGTENVNGVVWLLRQHSIFEGRVVEGIQVWKQGGKLGIVGHIGGGTSKRE